MCQGFRVKILFNPCCDFMQMSCIILLWKPLYLYKGCLYVFICIEKDVFCYTCSVMGDCVSEHRLECIITSGEWIPTLILVSTSKILYITKPGNQPYPGPSEIVHICKELKELTISTSTTPLNVSLHGVYAHHFKQGDILILNCTCYVIHDYVQVLCGFNMR